MPVTPPLFKRLLRNNIFRLSALYSVLFFIASLAMLGVAYNTIEKNIQQGIEQEIDAEITRYIGSYQSTQLGIQPNQYAFFIEHQGKKVAGNISEIPPSDTKADLIEVTADEIVASPNIETKGDIVGKTITLQNDTKLFIGKNSYSATERREDILDALSTTLLMLLIIGIVGGLFISLKSMKRIDRISRVSKAIMAGNLNLRIPTTTYNDDIEDLARNLNNMLDKIDGLMQGMKQVSDNIAHDLRTPLTRLRGNIETISRHTKGETNIEAENALLETDNLLSTFASLLRISQLESGAVKRNFEKINLSELVEELVDFYEVLADEKSQSLDINIQDNIYLNGDKSLLSQAIVNIFTNAIKYTPESGKIKIKLVLGSPKVAKKYAILTIHDNGSGVPEEQLSKITDRFYRLEAHRGKDNGNGLGLSLVKAIIGNHNGKLEFKNDNGLLAEIQLPLYTQST